MCPAREHERTATKTLAREEHSLQEILDFDGIAVDGTLGDDGVDGLDRGLDVSLYQLLVPT